MGLFDRLRGGLRKSAEHLGGGVSRIWGSGKPSDALLADLEEWLIASDLGHGVASELCLSVRNRSLKDSGAGSGAGSGDELALRQFLACEIAERLSVCGGGFVGIDEIRSYDLPYVMLVIGANGCGKTTTIAKLAHYYGGLGCRVLLAAGDVFRAAGSEQLVVWGKRLGIDVVSGGSGGSATGLIFDSHRRAIDGGYDLLIIDTAGRLHNKSDLMAELEKIDRVLRKNDELSPHASILVLDATTGGNAVIQAETFHAMVGLTHILMSKLDSSARGGVLVGLCARLGLPIMALGIGEGLDDLQGFDAVAFSEGLLGLE